MPYTVADAEAQQREHPPEHDEPRIKRVIAAPGTGQRATLDILHAATQAVIRQAFTVARDASTSAMRRFAEAYGAELKRLQADAGDDAQEARVLLTWLYQSGQLAHLRGPVVRALVAASHQSLSATLLGQQQAFAAGRLVGMNTMRALKAAQARDESDQGAETEGGEDDTGLIDPGIPGSWYGQSSYDPNAQDTGENADESQEETAPIAGYFDKVADKGWAALTGVIFAALASGMDPAQMLANMLGGWAGAAAYGLLVAESELTGAFRNALSLLFNANPNYVAGWIWQAMADACPFCSDMDQTFHDPDEDLISHPRCRCEQLPVDNNGNLIGGGDAADIGTIAAPTGAAAAAEEEAAGAEEEAAAQAAQQITGQLEQTVTRAEAETRTAVEADLQDARTQLDTLHTQWLDAQAERDALDRATQDAEWRTATVRLNELRDELLRQQYEVEKLEAQLDALDGGRGVILHFPRYLGDPLDRTEFEQVQRDLFGRELSRDELAALVGAPPGSYLDVSTRTGFGGSGPHYSSLDLYLHGPSWDPFKREQAFSEYDAHRLLSYDKSGQFLIMNNISFTVRDDLEGQGFGIRIFADEVDGLDKQGVRWIDTDAAGSGPRGEAEYGPSGANGYYTWPRFGYLGKIPEYSLDELRAQVAREEVPAAWGEYTTVQELMRTPEGRAWWKEWGSELELRFDLRAGSLSNRILDGYLDDKGLVVGSADYWQPFDALKAGTAEAPPEAPARPGEATPVSFATDTVRERLMERLSNPSDDEFARMMGAEPGATVEVDRFGQVYVHGPDDAYVAVRYVLTPTEDTGPGLLIGQYSTPGGEPLPVDRTFAEMLRTQVQAALDKGGTLDYLLIKPRPHMSDYEDLVHLGYDAPIDMRVLTETREQPLPADFAARFPEARTLSELIATPEGAAWWHDNGLSPDMRFDLAPGSASIQRLNDYLADEGGAAFAPAREPGEPSAGDLTSYTLTPDDKAFAASLKASIPDEGITTHADAIALGQQVRDRVESDLSDLQDLTREAAGIRSRAPNLTDDEYAWASGDPGAIAAHGGYHWAGRGSAEQAYRNAYQARMRAYLAEVRDVGGEPLDMARFQRTLPNWTGPLDPDAFVAERLATAADKLPADWVRASNDLGEVIPIRSTATNSSGWQKGNIDGSGVIAMRYRKGGDLAEYDATMLHELVHRMEDAIPALSDMQGAYYQARTAGEAFVRLRNGIGLDTKLDKWLDEYLGREPLISARPAWITPEGTYRYSVYSYELLTMGAEMLFAAGTSAATFALWADSDYVNFVLGAFLGVKGS